MAKGGLKLLMPTMAKELTSEKTPVRAFAPGAIRADIARDAWEDEAARDRLLKLIPYRRIGRPEDVATVAVWLSPDAAD